MSATINAPGAFDNSATATAAEFDPSPSNNADNAGNGGSATASTAIPALGEWPLILMVTILAALGALLIRR